MHSLIQDFINLFKTSSKNNQIIGHQCSLESSHYEESNQDFLRTLTHYDVKILVTALAYISRYQLVSEVSEKGQEVDMRKLTDEMVQTANHHLMELINHLHHEFQAILKMDFLLNQDYHLNIFLDIHQYSYKVL